MSKTSKKTKELVFIETVMDLSRRGDMDAIKSSLKAFFKNKRDNPWHRAYKIIEKKINSGKEEQKQAIVLLRDAFFGAFDLLSTYLVLDIPTSNLIEEYTKAKSWKTGRNKVRSLCAELLDEKIKRKDTYHLDRMALIRDGFGYLIPDIAEVRLDIYRRGRPEIKTRTEKHGRKKVEVQYLDLKKLYRSTIGRKLLREHGVVEEEIVLPDARAETLMNAFELLLVELEVDDSKIPLTETEQITLDGRPIEDDLIIDDSEDKKSKTLGVQTPLTEFIESDSKKESPKKRERKRAARKRKKKTGGRKK